MCVSRPKRILPVSSQDVHLARMKMTPIALSREELQRLWGPLTKREALSDIVTRYYPHCRCRRSDGQLVLWNWHARYVVERLNAMRTVADLPLGAQVPTKARMDGRLVHTFAFFDLFGAHMCAFAACAPRSRCGWPTASPSSTIWTTRSCSNRRRRRRHRLASA